jgi:hypothetical protein
LWSMLGLAFLIYCGISFEGRRYVSQLKKDAGPGIKINARGEVQREKNP